MLSKDELAAIQARCDAATPGPWGTGRDYDDAPIQVAREDANSNRVYETLFTTPGDDEEQERANAEFIASARTDAPALLAHIEALEAELADALLRLGFAESESNQWIERAEKAESELAAAREALEEWRHYPCEDVSLVPLFRKLAAALAEGGESDEN